MSKYIDRDHLARTIHTGMTSIEVMQAIMDAPAADVQEVKHGRWVYRGDRGILLACECSVCGYVENADWAILSGYVNYCPFCGAKMDEVEE